MSKIREWLKKFKQVLLDTKDYLVKINHFIIFVLLINFLFSMFYFFYALFLLKNIPYSGVEHSYEWFGQILNAIYFSVTTMTTVGYGDFNGSVNNIVRNVNIVHQLFNFFILAFGLISRIEKTDEHVIGLYNGFRPGGGEGSSKNPSLDGGAGNGSTVKTTEHGEFLNNITLALKKELDLSAIAPDFVNSEIKNDLKNILIILEQILQDQKVNRYRYQRYNPVDEVIWLYDQGRLSEKDMKKLLSILGKS